MLATWLNSWQRPYNLLEVAFMTRVAKLCLKQKNIKHI